MTAVEKRIPHVTLILPLSATESDARESAEDMIRNGLNLVSFEIVHVELLEEGLIQTPGGVKSGRRYAVAFRKTEGSVIYVHPDYEQIVANPFRG